MEPELAAESRVALPQGQRPGYEEPRAPQAWVQRAQKELQAERRSQAQKGAEAEQRQKADAPQGRQARPRAVRVREA